MTFLKRFTRHKTAFPLLLLITLFAAYGFQLHRMGFYWDDWPMVYLTSLRNPQPFWDFFSFDRPMAGWVYILLAPVFGLKPLYWQLFAILARWAGCLGFWVLFKEIWPQRKLEAGFAALLLAVYPGFAQQPISVTYSLFWVLYALFTWSMAASVIALRKPKQAVILTIIAILAFFMEAMSMEYVIGLEILRPVLFLLVLARAGLPWKKAIWPAIVRWIPFVIILGIFVYYRFVYFPQINTDPEANAPLLVREILAQPLKGILHLLQNILQDLSQSLVFVWGKSILPAEIDLSQTTNLFSWFIGLVMAALAVLLFWYNVKAESRNEDSDHFPVQAILIGLIAVILGGLPVWSTNRQIILGMWSDRFSLGLMLGIAILLTGLAAWFSRESVKKAVFLSVFLALGIAFQVQNTARYALNWDAQRDYYNQLLWRIPGLKPGTAILGDKVPFGLSAEYSTGFALNVIYPQLSDGSMPYWFFSAVTDRGGSIPDYVEGIPLKFDLRKFKYESSTSQGLAVYYKYGQSCLRVMTPAEKNFPNLSDSESELLAISHPDMILQESQRGKLPAELYGPELPHTWCYYFQKADLARQEGNWQGVLDIYDQANKAGFSPRNGTEYVPVIQALANNGGWDEAAQLTTRGVELTGSARPYFCDIWQSLRNLDGGKENVDKMRNLLECGES